MNNGPITTEPEVNLCQCCSRYDASVHEAGEIGERTGGQCLEMKWEILKLEDAGLLQDAFYGQNLRSYDASQNDRRPYH